MNQKPAIEISNTIVNFVEDNPGFVSEMQSDRDATFSLAATPSIDLPTFLSRPHHIKSFDWEDMTDFYESFWPWYDFLSLAQVKKKTSNYAYIKGNLHIKFVVNSSPSFYGLAIASYYPMEYMGGGKHHVDPTDRLFLIPMSQRQHVYIRPQQSQGGELVLPFVFHKNWLNLSLDNEQRSMGTIYVSSFFPLTNASGAGSGNSIDISVFSWMTDVELCQTTSHLEAQGDEFAQGHTGPISKVASAVATVAGRLSDVPVIGPFAKAFNIGGNAVAGIASIFGFSRVPIVNPTKFVRPQPYAPLAITDQPEPIDRLVFDSKQGLTVDPRTVGLSGDDELTIASIAQRESYLGYGDWAESTAKDTTITSVRIHPLMAREASFYYYMTPMAFAALPFRYWSGDIIVRVQVICSQFHRGRLLLQFDPREFGAAPVAVDTNLVYSQVLDLSVTRDFEIRIPFAADRAFLKVPPYRAEAFGATYTGAADKHTTNGTLTISVLNRLTSLAGTSTVRVVVSTRAAENMKFAVPIALPELSFNAPAVIEMEAQGDDMDLRTPEEGEPIKTNVDAAMVPTVDPDHTFDVYIGEQVVSFRPLLKRYTKNFVYRASDTAVSATRPNMRLLIPRFPQPGGYVSLGPSSDGVHYRNNIEMPLLTYIASAFVGMRGGTRIKITNPEGSTKVLAYGRSYERRTTSNYLIKFEIPDADSMYLVNDTYTTYYPNSWQGMGITDTRIQSGVEFELPHYSNLRFYSTDPQNVFDGMHTNPVTISDSSTLSYQIDDGSDQDSCLFTMSQINGINYLNNFFQTYYAAGDDFNVFWFQNVPTFYTDI